MFATLTVRSLMPGFKPSHNHVTTSMLLMAINPCYYSSMAYLVLWKVKASNLKYDKDEGCDRCMLACCTVPCAAYGEARQQYGIESEFPVGLCEDVVVGWFCYPCAIRRASMESVSRVEGNVVANLPAMLAKAAVQKAMGKG
eukprot:PhF_6_TR8733/c0_g2_i2/m.13732